ncbi:hypothetical protein [Nitrosovibrio sp. Nv4]|uniref:hypothetical protein n=1 Tax=Nitrosovibrio sp. Nv4 TaxID=1945880 RepID=UPI00135741FF|nr:hypothetical protein [Nitrosovibrio sp. Nv4]
MNKPPSLPLAGQGLRPDSCRRHLDNDFYAIVVDTHWLPCGVGAIDRIVEVEIPKVLASTKQDFLAVLVRYSWA